MSSTPDEPLGDTAESLFEHAPCSYLVTRMDGTIVRVNRTFEAWSGHARADLVGTRRFADLLTGGGRIYHETHYAPLLLMQGAVREIALDVRHADGHALPALVNSVVRTGDDGQPRVIHTTIFPAADRRRYEQELVRERAREHDIALALQRSLLAGALPPAVEVVYRPAEQGLEVGGDWYDAFALPGEPALGVVVGDVVGRGLGAAATMGQLRSALRALAGTGLGPAELLTALDAYAARHAVGQMTTIAYAEVDLEARVVRCACAGHPPPVVVPPGGAARFEWGGRSLPLDAIAPAPARTAVEVALEPGSRLVLYSDGLIERRDRAMQSSLDALLAGVDRAIAGGDEPLAEAILHEVHGRDGEPDDVCVVAVTLR